MRSSFTVIGVAALGFTACGGSRATVDPFSDAARSNLTDALTTAFCGALDACCDRAAMAHDADACAARVRPVYARYVEYLRGRVAYHPDRLAACQDAIRAGVAACRPRSVAKDARNTLLPHPCEELLEERPPPFTCSSAADCAAGGECVPYFDYEARRTVMSCRWYGGRPFDGEMQTCAQGMELTGGVCVEATNIGDGPDFPP